MIPAIIQLIQNLIGSPTYYEIVEVNGVPTLVQRLDLTFVVAGILLLMTVFCIYGILLHMVKAVGGKGANG